MREVRKSKSRHLVFLLRAVCVLLIFFGALSYWSAKWYINTYGDIGFEAVLFTMLSGVEATASSIILDYLKKALVPSLCFALPICCVLMFRSRKSLWLTFKGHWHLRLFPFLDKAAAVVSVIISVALLVQGASIFGFPKWLKMKLQQTSIYQDEYVAPTAENVVFEGEKRNLIYIYLESMENTFFSTQQGGALPYNVIPELYELAEDHINFSDNSGVGGGVSRGGEWTIGAMTAQTSGLPLKFYYEPGADGNTIGTMRPFLPGAVTLCDILHENGYYQALMVGSDAEFGGRRQLYEQHGADKIYDLYTAREDGLIPSDYYVWWGFEDLYLFRYAKQELLKIAEQEQAFAFTMLTVDTHHIGGYVCELCQDRYEEQYENVYACSSRQVYEFVQWIQQQDFYADTTIILTGDHISMDEEYMKRNVPADYVRRVYNCVINPAVEPANSKDREFTTMDMFPTTLTAMGAKIRGDRLGLGTDLFSETPTLLEKHGSEWWEKEITKGSDHYVTHFATGGK